MLKLKVYGNAKEGVWLVEPKISVGSASANNLVVDDPNVDDVHIEIFVKGEELIIHRRSDANTLVNGKKLGVKARIAVGDEIVVGTTKLEVIDPKAERAKRQASEPEQPTAIKPKQQQWQLTAAQTGLARNTYDIKDGMVIGRAKDCDIVILLAHLSRRHAQFNIVGNNRLEITDLNSSNGTFVNGKQITNTILSHGDEVRFDTLSFKVTGPQDDMDKTMVRPMTTEELADQMDLATAKAQKSKPKPALEKRANQNQASAEAVDKSSSSNMPLILGAVAAAVVVAVVVGLIL